MLAKLKVKGKLSLIHFLLEVIFFTWLIYIGERAATKINSTTLNQ